MKNFYILIAEDDLDDRFILKTAFKEMNNEDNTEFVENGEDLMNLLTSKTHSGITAHFPDLILLDLNMPKKDGRETLKELKSHPIFKVIPVVVFTTTIKDSEIIKCYDLGANTYITKPASYQSLLGVLEIIRKYWLTTSSVF